MTVPPLASEDGRPSGTKFLVSLILLAAALDVLTSGVDITWGALHFARAPVEFAGLGVLVTGALGAFGWHQRAKREAPG